MDIYINLLLKGLAETRPREVMPEDALALYLVGQVGIEEVHIPIHP